MRNELPITGNEHRPRGGEFNRSRARLKARSACVNRGGVENSRHKRKALTDGARRIHRHPDMPREALAELRHGPTQGPSRHGMAKGRCGSGDCGQVKDCAQPVRDGQHMIGRVNADGRAGDAQAAP